MEVTARLLDGVRFEASTRGHTVISDQPADNGGADSGMTPPEFLLASLATCGAFYAAQYLKTRGLSTDGLEVKVMAEKARQPARLSAFQIDVLTGLTLDDRHREGLLRAVKSCIVHNTLENAPSIGIAIRGETPPEVRNTLGGNGRLSAPRSN
jgi:putative redox protein